MECPSFLRPHPRMSRHTDQNRILRRALKATITLKEAENDVLKGHVLRDTIHDHLDEYDANEN